MCRVPSCTNCFPNQPHFCVNCGGYDVTHRSFECPSLIGTPSVYGVTYATLPNPPDRSSRTRSISRVTFVAPSTSSMSYECTPRVETIISPSSITYVIPSSPVVKACRAPGCTSCLPGETHFCTVCRVNDVDHRSFNCPNRVKVVHVPVIMTRGGFFGR